MFVSALCAGEFLAMAVDKQQTEQEKALAALVQHDPVLGWLYGTFVPVAADYKAKNNATITWDKAPAPPEKIVKVHKVNQDTFEKERIVDSAGKPIPAARLAMLKAKAKYRPDDKGTKGDMGIFTSLRSIERVINKASGIKRGRGGS
jgi:hypothetical protein